MQGRGARDLFLDRFHVPGPMTLEKLPWKIRQSVINAI